MSKTYGRISGEDWRKNRQHQIANLLVNSKEQLLRQRVRVRSFEIIPFRWRNSLDFIGHRIKNMMPNASIIFYLCMTTFFTWAVNHIGEEWDSFLHAPLLCLLFVVLGYWIAIWRSKPIEEAKKIQDRTKDELIKVSDSRISGLQEDLKRQNDKQEELLKSEQEKIKKEHKEIIDKQEKINKILKEKYRTLQIIIENNSIFSNSQSDLRDYLASKISGIELIYESSKKVNINNREKHIKSQWEREFIETIILREAIYQKIFQYNPYSPVWINHQNFIENDLIDINKYLNPKNTETLKDIKEELEKFLDCFDESYANR